MITKQAFVQVMNVDEGTFDLGERCLKKAYLHWRITAKKLLIEVV